MKKQTVELVPKSFIIRHTEIQAVIASIAGYFFTKYLPWWAAILICIPIPFLYYYIVSTWIKYLSSRLGILGIIVAVLTPAYGLLSIYFSSTIYNPFVENYNLA